MSSDCTATDKQPLHGGLLVTGATQKCSHGGRKLPEQVPLSRDREERGPTAQSAGGRAGPRHQQASPWRAASLCGLTASCQHAWTLAPTSSASQSSAHTGCAWDFMKWDDANKASKRHVEAGGAVKWETHTRRRWWLAQRSPAQGQQEGLPNTVPVTLSQQQSVRTARCPGTDCSHFTSSNTLRKVNELVPLYLYFIWDSQLLCQFSMNYITKKYYVFKNHFYLTLKTETYGGFKNQIWGAGAVA